MEAILIEKMKYLRWLVIFLVMSYAKSCNGDVKHFDDTILFKFGWPGSVDDTLLDLTEVEPLLVSTINKERYKCLIPSLKDPEKESSEVYDGPNPLALLEPLFQQSSCSYRLESYWTYELCHGKHVRQYHEDREGKTVKLQEYFLGRWDKFDYRKYNEINEEESKHQSPSDIPVKKIDGVNMPYLQINMTDGTTCDLNGKPRATRILYVCFMQGKHEVYSFRESSTCEYEMVVLSPLLCQHPNYRPKETSENLIQCLPLEGSPKKPRSLMQLEAESLKLKHQKQDDSLQKIFAVYTIEKNEQLGGGQEETRVRVEIHPMDILGTPEDSSSSGSSTSSPSVIPAAAHNVDNALISDFLKGEHCLHGGTGWWRYEFCYGKKVDQYHEEKDGSRSVIHLGFFNEDKHKSFLDENPHKKPKPLLHRHHISHMYSEGSKCDETGKLRQVEVKLKCMRDSSPSSVALYLLEPKMCEYILGVESPIICPLIENADEYGLPKADFLADVNDVTVTEDEDSTDSSSEKKGE